MADNYNHLDQEIQVTLINKPEHLNTSATSPEFIKEKFMNDYSIVFKEELEQMAGNSAENTVEKQLNIRGRFIREHYESNQQFSDLDKIKEAIESNENLWDVPRLKEGCEYAKEMDSAESDDNETEEEASAAREKIEEMMGDEVL